MKIYTRGGDKGKTSIIGKARRFKDDIRIEAYGTVDEAGAYIGLIISELEKRNEDIREHLLSVQQMLWNVGADLAAAPDADYNYRTPENAAAELEPLIDSYREEADQITKFILRGGSRHSAQLHVACTIVRRAERCTVACMRQEGIHLPALKYLNRLSDLLFVMARAVNARENIKDIDYRNSTEVFKNPEKRD